MAYRRWLPGMLGGSLRNLTIRRGSGLVVRHRANAINRRDRGRMLAVSVQGAAALESHMADQRVREVYGSLHLHAGLAQAVLGNADEAGRHLDEADDVARTIEQSASPSVGFGELCFGPDNVALWRMAIAIEQGDGGRVGEIARRVDLGRLNKRDRTSAYWTDLGMGMASESGKADQAIMALRRGEDAAPVFTRTRPLVREAVTDLLPRARSDSARREIRGMAYRMGMAG